jgi:nitrate reductase alpha subunit
VEPLYESKSDWWIIVMLVRRLAEKARARGIISFTDPDTGEVIPLGSLDAYETATGRIQFYIDHDWYLKLGEAFACHKEPIKAGGDYPIQLLGGHSRWSINSVWADDALLLQLQRGEPLLWLSPQDAQARGIRDGDRVEAFNDVGSFQAQVKSRILCRGPQEVSCPYTS